MGSGENGDLMCNLSGGGGGGNCVVDKECVACGKSKAKLDWGGLPAGVRFDPSDEELLEHLAAKIGRGPVKAHPLLDDFIFTLEEEDGICRTHPEKLPGVKKDGSSCHYFHRPSMAYTTGTRKRRKIQSDDHLDGGADVRWHKTGKTRPVSQNGDVLGFKKIMVLYKATGKKSKNVKTNWVMHQYHLGHHEEERDGELVVCKVFFQKAPRSCPSRKTATTAQDDEDCEPSESDIGFQEPVAAGLSGDSPPVSAVTKGLPPLTPKSFVPSRTSKQLYTEPTESISEIFDPHALATQSKQNGAHVQSVTFNSIKTGSMDVHESPSASALQKLQGPVENLEIPLNADQQLCLVNGGGVGDISCEGEDESFHTVNLNEEHQSWDINCAKETNHFNEVDELFCGEQLNGDPLVQDADYAQFNWRSCAYDVGCSLEEEPFRGDTGSYAGEQAEVDPALNDLELDTPPELLEYPVVTSQEVREFFVANQKSFADLDNTDSQSTT